MGVERIACLLQDVDNVYETDLLRPVIDQAARADRRGYGAHPEPGAGDIHADDVRSG